MEGSSKIPSHANRIYALKFLSESPYVFVTAGWDNIVAMWDIRTNNSVAYVYGPKVYGDSLDY